jgi:hypothetical protein
MTFQYLVLLRVAHATNRPQVQSFIIFCSTVFSMICSIIAAAVHTPSRSLAVGRVFIFYLGIFGEWIGEFTAVTFLRSYVRPKPERLSERLGALTLIIM